MVTSLADETLANLAGDGEVSLREAIEAANTNQSVDGSVAGSGGEVDRIEFQPGLTGTILLTAKEQGPIQPFTISDSLTIVGPGQELLTIDAQLKSRVVDVPRGDIDVTIEGFTLTRGRTFSGPIIGVPEPEKSGGAIRFLSSGRLTVRNSTVSNSETRANQAVGGAIFSDSGLVLIASSTIKANRTSSKNTHGGGIASVGGVVTVVDSTVSGNSTLGTGAGGGAIYAAGGVLAVSNSTISDNNLFGDEAESADGGGILVRNADLTIESSTITDNTASGRGGGVVFIADQPGSKTLRLENSIVAGNRGTSGVADLLVPASPQSNLVATHSLIGDNTGISLGETRLPDAVGNLIGTAASPIDPLLGPLQNNGGATETHALLTGSPAIDAGDRDAVAGQNGLPEYDQRGAPISRFADGNHGGRAEVDMGAFEYRPATTWVVDTLVDEQDGDISEGELSLREAVLLANGSPGVADTIRFAKSLTVAGPAEIDLVFGQLEITDALTIIGTDRDLLTIDAQQNSRLFSVPSGDFDLAIEGLTLTGGDSTGMSDGPSFGRGGAILFFSTGRLDIRNSALSGNTTTADGAAGGAVFSDLGDVTLANSLVSGNSTTGSRAGGGGIAVEDGSLTITNSTIAGNSTMGPGGFTADGGGVYSGLGTLTVINSHILDNSTAGESAHGGGIGSSGTTTVTNSIISGNRTTGSFAWGGGIRAFRLTVSSSTISGNTTTGQGSQGGGIDSSVLVLHDSTIAGNITTGSGAAGGGISSQTATISNSTITGNSATGDGTPLFSGGGGVALGEGDLTIINSTITDNNAPGTVFSKGGGVLIREPFNQPNGELLIINSIIAGNRVGGGTQGPDLEPNSLEIVTVMNSLIGDNSGTGLDASLTPDASGNLIGTAASPIDPLLAPLADNGGLTQTHALLAGSPAIDRGDASLTVGEASTPQFDQRGAPFSRVADGGSGSVRLDLGAYEFDTVLDLNLVVDIMSDEDDGDYHRGDLSLREAIHLANEQPGEQTITFDPLVFGATHTIDLLHGEMTITESLTISGPGHDFLTLDAHQQSRIFNMGPSEIAANFDVTIEGLRLIGGRTALSNQVVDSAPETTHAGGAIRFNSTGALSLIDSTVSKSTTEGHDASGGGVYSSGSVVLLRTIVSGNSTAGDSAHGGGVYARAAIVMTDSTVSGNSTTGSGALGGGAFSAGTVTSTGTTVSGNSTVGDGASGGGIYLSEAGTLTSTTVTGNSTAGRQAHGGGVFMADSATNAELVITNSIIAGNTVTGVESSGSEFLPDPDATLTVTYSLIADNSDTGLLESQTPNEDGSLIGTASSRIDAKLGPLAYNGGFTPTHPLLLGSPAIDAADPFALAGVNGVFAFDQRGAPFTRVFDGDGLDDARLDMGATERQTLPNLNLVVGTTIDERDASHIPDDLTLREAIGLANGSVNGATPDAISFSPSLSRDGPATVGLLFGELQITDGVTITGLGAGALIIDGGEKTRIFDILHTAGDVTFDRLTIRHGKTAGPADDGGGVRSRSPGTLTLVSSAVSGNSTIGPEAHGGGISVQGGGLLLSNSTSSGNSTNGDYADGGGIFVDTDTDGSQVATISNSTLSANTSRRYGGGFFNGDGLTMIRHSTITDNQAPFGFGSGAASDADSEAVTDVASSIIAGNASTDIASTNEVANSFRSGGFNLIGLGNAIAVFDDHDQTNVTDPLLGRLGDNGSSLQTHALLLGSPAIDAGPTDAVSGQNGVPDFDQRGAPFVRTFDAGNGSARIDIGAIERQTVSNLNLVVDTTIDENDGIYTAGDLSLREAIGLANGNVNGATTDEVSFAPRSPAGTAATFGLSLGELRITDDVTIAGHGAGSTIIDGQQSSRVFDIIDLAGDVMFDNLSITNGATTGQFAAGGGIRSRTTGTLTVNRSKVAGHSTSGSAATGGAISVQDSTLLLSNSEVTDSSTVGVDARGGGISAVDSHVTLVDSFVSANTTSGRRAAGGGIVSQRGMLVLSGSTLSGNTTSGREAGGGGILASEGDLTLTSSTFLGNSTIGLNASGGGILALASDLLLTSSNLADNGTVFGRGGGLRANGSTVTLIDSTVSGNSTTELLADGGGISAEESVLTLTRSTVSGNSTAYPDRASGGGISTVGGTLNLTDSTVFGNATKGGGGGISATRGTLMLTGTTVSENSSMSGGGIYIGGSTLTLLDSTLSGNSSVFGGGGVLGFQGTLTVVNSTVSGNAAGSLGGGIQLSTSSSQTQTASITNSTISGNTAVGDGGGLYNLSSVAVIHQTTITNNTAQTGFGSGIAGGSAGSRTEIAASIIAGNTTTDVHNANSGPSLYSNGFNLIGTGNALDEFTNNDQTNVADPRLAPLADNGGPTRTHAPLPGSPAINAGGNATLPADVHDLDGDGDAAEPLPVDQRGFARVIDLFGIANPAGVLDIGAVESEPGLITVPAGETVVTNESGTVFVRSDGSVLLQDDRENLSELNFVGGAENETLAVGELELHAGQEVAIRFHGQAGHDTLRLTASAYDLDLTGIADADLQQVETIDITGSGNNTLTLDASEVLSTSSATSTLRVKSNAGDTVSIGSGWTFGGTMIENGDFIRVLTQGEATLELDGPFDWSYPENPLDTNGSGSVDPIDALVVINELNNPRYTLASNRLVDAALLAEFPSLFLDASPDGFASPIDALVIINFLNDPLAGGEGEATVARVQLAPREISGNNLIRSSQVDNRLDHGDSEGNSPNLADLVGPDSEPLRQATARQTHQLFRTELGVDLADAIDAFFRDFSSIDL